MMQDIKFENKINKTDSCWLWTGATRPNGYGVIRRKGLLLSTHRYSYEYYVGEIPKGKIICHSCDVRLCVNPKHLWAGTSSENMVDCFKKGRMIIKRKYNSPAEQKRQCWARYYKKYSKEIQERRKLKRQSKVLQ